MNVASARAIARAILVSREATPARQRRPEAMHIPIKTLSMAVLATLLVAGCASTPRADRNLARIGFGAADTAEGDVLFRRIGAEPTNARLHFENGRYLLAGGRQGDLRIARVAFANAARLAPDWWEPRLGLAAAEYRLGRYDEALAGFGEAIELRGSCGSLCYGMAFFAYRAGCFGLAATAFQRARAEAPPATDAGRAAAAFLDAAFADGPGARDAAPLRALVRGPEPTKADDSGNVSIDAYVIRKSRDASSSAGINLLNALQLQFGATLWGGEYSRAGEDPFSRSNSHGLEVSIPTVSYALNMASASRNAFSLEASPSVVAVEGKTSRFFEGANVLIVPGGDKTEPLERDIGIELKVTPNEIDDDSIALNAILELSNISASQVVGVGATVVQTEKTQAEANARIPFGRAIALGSGATMTVRDGSTAVPGLRRLPGGDHLFGNDQASAKRNDVLVLLTAHRGIASSARVRVDEAALSQRLFGAAPAAVARVSRLPSQAPRIELLDWL
jgi:tetratricopeptide (TPR) repeat protein